MWSSVARRRTDLVPTITAPRAPGRAYSMTRLDKIPPQRPLHSASPSLHHLNRTQCRSGETTPSRPGSALSQAAVVRRAGSAPRKPRPASIAGTGVNTPRALSVAPGEGKPPLHRKPKLSKDLDKSRGKSASASPCRPLSPSPASKESSVDKELAEKKATSADKNQVSAIEVTQKLEALQIQNGDTNTRVEDKVIENKETIETQITNTEQNIIEVNPVEVQKPIEKKEEVRQEKKEEVKKEEDKKEVVPEKKESAPEKKESSQEKTDENEMTASMTARRITTEEEAKAALAERRRRAREELERQADLERQRLQREAEEEAERQKQEEERQRREEEEARELAALQRRLEEEKLRKAIEAQQQFEREENERRQREEAEKKARQKEDEDKRRAAEEAERLRREEAEREEKERLARKQRVEAIMARTRLKKQEEEKKQQEKSLESQVPAPADNGNDVITADLLGLPNAQPEESKTPENETRNNGNERLIDLAGDEPSEEAKEAPTLPSGTTNGNHVDYAAHNGHTPHPLTLHNAI